MGNHLAKQERFNLLLQQLAIPPEFVEKYFVGGLIDKVDVYRQEKRWHFFFELPELLPLNVYQAFYAKLTQTFSNIAAVDCDMRYAQPVPLAGFVKEYWPLIVEKVTPHINSTATYLKNATYEVEDNKLKLGVLDTFAIEKMKQRKVDDWINQTVKKLCGESLVVTYYVARNEETYQQFVEQREEEDRTRAMEALLEKQKEKEKIEASKEAAVAGNELQIGYEIKEEPIPIREIQEEMGRTVIQGLVFGTDIRELRSGRTLCMFNITDYTDSLQVKVFARDKEDVPKLMAIKNGIWVKVRGTIQEDTFARELVMTAKDIVQVQPTASRMDNATEKRVEFHCHTNMSAMDGVASAERLIKQAAEWGHKAIAITDHAVAQAFPEAFSAAKKYGIKVIYGMEANVVPDSAVIVHQPQSRELADDTYVIFDVETTGLSVVNNTIIEIAGVKMKNGEIIGRYESFVNPHEPIPLNIQQLTNITDDMVKDAPELDQVIREFVDFVGDAVLVAHNAKFDMGFLQASLKKVGLPPIGNPFFDTLELARFLYPGMRNHRLNTLAEKFNVSLENHHRAVDDSEATGHIFFHMLKDVLAQDITNLDDLNNHVGLDLQNARPFHCNIYALNEIGKKNLYKLISLSHTEYLYKTPRIPRAQIQKHREGLLISSGCEKGEFFETVLNKSQEEAEEVARFYDILEIQPIEINRHLIEKQLVPNEAALMEANRKIVEIGEKLGIPVIATGNVHYVHPYEKDYREILIHGITGFSPLKEQYKPDAHFRTTEEMLEEFRYLGEEKAKEVVITNPNMLADQFEELEIIPKDLYTPKIEGADEEIRTMSYNKAKELYGDPLPEIVEKRLEKELNSIITHGFAVIYLISHKLVKKSIEDGYLVGSRGSVGSSFVATMTEITEVNPLPPHYRCPECKHSEWFTKGEYGSGFDLPSKDCPKCGTTMVGDGHDIPFETFLGFKGDKVPDIDLNFSGEYQPHAHNYTKVLFGEDYVYRAGTIGTVAEKTAYGFVRKYAEEKGKNWRNAEMSRLAAGCTGVKRTTGQHPGGIIVVPDYMEIYDFCPIQYPADDKNAEWRTTHYDFHSIHDNLLKLDILGHDDPTVIRMLQDLTGLDPKKIPVCDPKVMKIFSGTEVLGVTPEQIESNVGTLGIPEFGTKFVRQMLEDTRPSTFAELVQISGLSHGTDVWLNNAQELVRNGTCELKDVIGCRDDIMVYLMHKGLEPSFAFKIMESVRKGKGLTPEMEEEMKKHNVPDWYIWSCKQIKYMFPKAHATAYVLMAVRIAYFKVYYPIHFYATYFTVRADDFDIELAVQGSAAIRARMKEIAEKGNDAQPKEKSLYTVLEMCLEMCERGFSFKNVDLYRSDATRFIIDGNSLIPPFNALAGVGTSAAINIVKAREEGEFLSIEDLQQRARCSRSVIELLQQQGCLDSLPETNQLSLF
ncbi:MULTISPECIES: PolC-type DNA polymerase III [Aneurinibacillus]|uniref:DNA polymerase III PolC-type n=1 Tax=Aneurinibacillus thermoaerophilus TaxID=143495 RepID=A0A1G7WG01_ANETH|nr:MULTISPECIES: PolC-type DNA polymerase III [Aneurinibacillus]MED0674575.1 PolC-type DNA polymerase III [Aneurinibacillus thermoaerophilus]MED0736993.1 PolC-type DNA polymerase III [Aneurinibacillus thermoaerophilus]QYY41544.1 PolC-type DNA polymerase III [Aneurinibacillus thermoaerophilus]SDG70957.1 DNA polymerase-3 subunit alpha [Aneurinibacillus thermoaerophilus]